MKIILVSIVLSILSFLSFAQTSDEIIKSFRQGAKEGDLNCASIAIIKCAIGIFGIDNVCKTENIDSGYKITLRDRSIMNISKSQIQISETYSGFDSVKDSNIYNKAIILYAAMGMRAYQLKDQVKLFTECSSYEKGLEFLHAGVGISSEAIAVLIGLKCQDISYESKNNKNAFIVGNYYHAAFGGNGKYDDYGSPVEITKIFKRHRTLGGSINGRNKIGLLVLIDIQP